jgi:CAAX prenyl protease-like protein
MRNFLSPAGWRRVLPFVVFMALLSLRGQWQPAWWPGLDPQWLYALQAGVPALLLALWWRDFGELHRANAPTWREVLLSVAVGLVVFALWIRLDAPWMTLLPPTASFVPVDAQGGLQWPLIGVRWLGATLLVPLMEELFWRSFLMRWVQDANFAGLPPQRVGLRAVVIATFVFTLAHTLWLAAVMAGLAYAWLYIRTGRLWCAVISHAVTNGALGAWVVATGRWQFW